VYLENNYDSGSFLSILALGTCLPLSGQSPDVFGSFGSNVGLPPLVAGHAGFLKGRPAYGRGAWNAGIQPLRRTGNGAVRRKHRPTGSVCPKLRLPSPTCAALQRRPARPRREMWDSFGPVSRGSSSLRPTKVGFVGSFHGSILGHLAAATAGPGDPIRQILWSVQVRTTSVWYFGQSNRARSL
jgi:hypothetical protein